MRERDPMNTAVRPADAATASMPSSSATRRCRVSGLLNATIGGPSVKPYQPPGYWASLNFPVREWQKDAGDEGVPPRHVHALAAVVPASGDGRVRRAEPRGMHLRAAEVEHSAASARAAERPGVRGSGEGVRGAHTHRTAGQADGAKGAVGVPSARPAARPGPAEAQVLLGLLNKHRAEFATTPDEREEAPGGGRRARAEATVKPEELAAWVSVCRVILNLHETITRP